MFLFPYVLSAKRKMQKPLILRVGNVFVDIIGEIPTQKKKELEKKLSFRPQGFQFSPLYNKFIRNENGEVVRRFWDGWKRQFWSGKKRTYFPTGLYSFVKEFLTEHTIPYVSEDIRQKPDRNIELELHGSITPYDYQQEVIDEACNRSRGIIQAATGAGKTVIGAGICKQLGTVPFLFFVTSVDLLEQAKDSFERVLRQNGQRITVGQIGGGIIDIRDINVCTVQTVVRALGKKWDRKTRFDGEDKDDKTPIEEHREEIIEVVREAKASICDEVQHWRADTCQLVARELHSCYNTFGMSATPYRDEGDDMMIQACFGRKCAEITATELIERGYLVRPDIKIVHFRGKKSKYKSWQSLYKDKVTENKYYNGVIANIANSYIAAGRLVLVLVQHVGHGQELASLIQGSQFLSGVSPKKKRKIGLDNLRNGYIRAIVSTAIFDEGIDVRPLDTVLLAGQGKSRTRAMQRVGRITRPYTGPNGKKIRATAIDFCIHDKYLLDHATEREKMYRTETAYRIEHIDPRLK